MLVPENVVKRIDNLGRITLPKGLRDRMRIADGAEMEIFTADIDGRKVICLAEPKKDEYLRQSAALLMQKYYKVIQVNFKEDSYFEIKVDGEEERKYRGLRHWVDEFSKVGVWGDDKERFLKFFDDYKSVCYRRLINDTWRWVIMEKFDIDEDVALLVVRDIEEEITKYSEV